MKELETPLNPAVVIPNLLSMLQLQWSATTRAETLDHPSDHFCLNFEHNPVALVGQSGLAKGRDETNDAALLLLFECSAETNSQCISVESERFQPIYRRVPRAGCN